jgi:sulfite exporter TauE/SafE
MEFLAGLTIGFLGSLHCIGMCGPLAVALPFSNTGGKAAFYGGRLLYNLGRIVTYSLLGLVVGFVGRFISLAGWQQTLSVAAGLAILLTLFLPTLIHRLSTSVARFTRISMFIQRTMGSLLQHRLTSTLFLIGILNGLLPCGFVYVGLAGAATTGHPALAASFMAGFGAGTMPAMFGSSVAGKLFSVGVRRKLTIITPAFTFLVAVLIILRGLNLGIPYISPVLLHQNQTEQTEPECCH